MKVFKNSLKKNSKTISLRKKVGDLGNVKYLPSFSKEWKNIIYSYNKNIIKNIPTNTLNTNRIVKSYFDLYFKDYKFVGSNKFVLLKRRRNFLRKIHLSNVEIKHTNNKAVITLYVVNREKKVLEKKYFLLKDKINKYFMIRFFSLYRNNLIVIYNILEKFRKEFLFFPSSLKKSKYLGSRFEYLIKFIKLKHLYSKKIWSVLINNFSMTYLDLLRRYNLLYSLNQFKFNNNSLLSKLSNILQRIIGKSIQYNIINLKSILYNTDIFTNALSLKIGKKNTFYSQSMISILNRVHLPYTNTIQERSSVRRNNDVFQNKYKDLNIISHLNNNILDKLLYDSSNYFSLFTNKSKSKSIHLKKIHSLIYNTVGYKNMAGVRLEVKGRLTKRYRADRSVYSMKWKGGLKNIDSSFRGLTSVLFRGNTKSNTSYSLSTSKKRIGAFAVKGWMSGK